MKKPINNYDRAKYYRAMALSLMNKIEEHTSLVFHDIDAQLEKRFWYAADNNLVKELREVHSELCELHDAITMDEEELSPQTELDYLEKIGEI